MRRKKFGQNDGQTLVEFALVLPIFLLIVMGVLEFGRAITYWHDLNNTAQVAARYAVVNRYPGCPGSCNSPNTFLEWVETDLNSGALATDPSTVPTVCYTDANGNGAPNVGEPLTVMVTSTFKPAAFLKLFNITLRGKATLRIEQPSLSNIAGLTTNPPC